MKLTAQQKTEDKIKIFATLLEEDQRDQESVTIVADDVHSYFESNHIEEKYPKFRKMNGLILYLTIDTRRPKIMILYLNLQPRDINI